MNVGETHVDIFPLVCMNIYRVTKIHVFKHLKDLESGRSLANENCYSILDTGNNIHQLKLKEPYILSGEKPNLNKQLFHTNLTLSSSKVNTHLK